ncbi:hypothetical protein BGZ74_003233 [Mortierella antarctica]|nr:hypothetical protein BGZ74_003233 [Mortierella antarctica]
MTHAFLPSELLLLIAEHFAPEEATSPIFVCRAWHDVFASVIWRTYSINALTQLSLDVLINHSHLVKELTYKGCTIPLEYFSIPFTRLTHLTVDSGFTGFFGEEALSHFAGLVALNNQLEELVIHGQSFAAEDTFWSSVASRPHLRRLTLERCSMESKGFAPFWRSLIRVEQLTIHRYHNINTKDFFYHKLEPLPALHSIDLDQVDMIPLLKLCANLRKSLQHLDSLVIYGVRDDRRLSLFLGAMDQLKELVLPDGVVGRLSLNALRRHFPTLQQVLFSDISKVPSKAIQTIMESCPQLTSLIAPWLSASRILGGGQWKCTKLRVLKADIAIKDEKQEAIRAQSREIFERLSKLEDLTALIIRGPTAETTTRQGLDLRLESGLGQLSTLRNLRHLDFRFTKQNMSPEDVAWINTHWKRLEQVEGRYLYPQESYYHVAEFFTPGDAASPCLVSRDWQNIFADRIWSKCTLSEHDRLPPVEGLIRNANHVTEHYLFGTNIRQG